MIITFIIQFIFYKINYKKGNKLSNFLIAIIVILTYIFFEKYNHYNAPYLFQVIVIGATGMILTLITYVFWYFKKENIGRNIN